MGWPFTNGKLLLFPYHKFCIRKFCRSTPSISSVHELQCTIKEMHNAVMSVVSSAT